MTETTLKQLTLASNNLGKVKEIQAMASDLDWEIIPQSTFNTPEIAEIGLSFIENAIIKARNAAKYSGLPALADDSGLEVLALSGAPGIYSARFSGEQANDNTNNDLLLEKLLSVPEENRQANFRCCFALVKYEHDPTPIIAEGIWQGSIAFEKKGNNGFGYDPLFIVNSINKHSAELLPSEKNKISHRAKAFTTLVKKICELNV